MDTAKATKIVTMQSTPMMTASNLSLSAFHVHAYISMQDYHVSCVSGETSAFYDVKSWEITIGGTIRVAYGTMFVE